MTRLYFNKKDTVEECIIVSISFLKKHGFLSGFHSSCIVWKNNRGQENSIRIEVSTIYDEDYARFQYIVTDKNTGEAINYDYKVSLTTTPCNYGGVRYWFNCPLCKNAIDCGRRVAKLYKAPGAHYFGCRHCYNLSYQSRNESHRGGFGNLMYLCKAEKEYEELLDSIKRWTWRQRPTKKVKRLLELEQRINQAAYAGKQFLDSMGMGV